MRGTARHCSVFIGPSRAWAPGACSAIPGNCCGMVKQQRRVRRTARLTNVVVVFTGHRHNKLCFAIQIPYSPFESRCKFATALPQWSIGKHSSEFREFGKHSSEFRKFPVVGSSYDTTLRLTRQEVELFHQLVGTCKIINSDQQQDTNPSISSLT